MSFHRSSFSPSLVFLTPNYGSKAEKIKDDNVLFFGGGCNKFRDSVVIYNIVKNSYQKFALNNEQFNFDYSGSYFVENQFCGLAAFDMAYIEKDNTVLIYGGITEDNSFSDTLYELKNYNELKVIQTVGDIPSPRIGHTFTKINDNEIVLFGGVENISTTRYELIPKYLNDVYILHINNHCYRWKKIEESNFEAPCPRESHSTVLYKNQLIIYGGMDGQKRLNDTWMLDLNTFAWKKLITNGTIALARSMHTATLVDNEMYIFGGFVHDRLKTWKCTSSMQCLNLDSYKWINFSSVYRPNPRAGHAAIEHHGRIYIWSGRDDSRFDEIHPVTCHNDVWYFESRKPLSVIDLRVTKCDRKSFKVEWTESINAVLYVVELKEVEDKTIKESITEPMIEDEEEILIIENHPETIFVEKAVKSDQVASTKPKIIIHENILLTPPNTIYTDHLFNNSSTSENYEIVNFLPDDQRLNIEQMDGETDLIESEENTDFELETYEASISKDKNIPKNCWYLVGIYKLNSCNIENYNLYILNRHKISSDCIPNLIGSKLIPIESGKTYCVRVTALNSNGLSDFPSNVVSLTTKVDEPIYNIELLSYNDFYTLKWSSTYSDVDFQASLEINTGTFVKSAIIHKGTACECKISKRLLEKVRISDEFTINIRVYTAEGQILYGTDLKCYP